MTMTTQLPTSTALTMPAIVHSAYGTDPTSILDLADVPRPVVGDDEVLVRVAAASVDRGTWHIMAGLPYPIRLAGFGLRTPKYLNPGRSLAGTVAAVGKGVDGFVPGDEVFGIGDGTFAEYAAAPADKLARMPANVTFEEAATVPISGITALQAVRDHAQVKAGQRVLIIGASGGVGSFAVQIAKALGAHVTGVASTGKVDFVRGLGADRVIDYTVPGALDAERGYDAILDIAGNRRVSRLRRALTPTGTLLIVGGETDGRWLGGTQRQIGALVLSPFVSQKLGTFVASENGGDLVALRELVERGAVVPPVDRSYPLSEVAAAIDYLVAGHPKGKVAITV